MWANEHRLPLLSKEKEKTTGGIGSFFESTRVILRLDLSGKRRYREEKGDKSRKSCALSNIGRSGRAGKEAERKESNLSLISKKKRGTTIRNSGENQANEKKKGYRVQNGSA